MYRARHNAVQVDEKKPPVLDKGTLGFFLRVLQFGGPGGGPLDPHRNSVQNAGVFASGARTATLLVVGIPWYYHGLWTTMVYVLPWSMYYHGSLSLVSCAALCRTATIPPDSHLH